MYKTSSFDINKSPPEDTPLPQLMSLGRFFCEKSLIKSSIVKKQKFHTILFSECLLKKLILKELYENQNKIQCVKKPL